MNSGDRWALALALGMSADLSAPSCAQKGEVAATSAKIAELSRAGKYAEAVPLAQGQLESLEKKYGLFNSDVAGALNNLALLYADQGRDAEAEPLYKRAIAIMEKVRGIDSAEVAPELNNLAALYQRRERYADAEPLFECAPAIRENSLPHDHPDIARSLNNLSTLYQSEGRNADAPPIAARMIGSGAVQAAASDVADLNDASSPKNAYPAFWGPFALIGEGAAPDPR